MRKLMLALCAAALLAAPGARSGEEQKEAAGLSAEKAERLAGLVRQLGHEDYAKREAASRELEKFGRPALPALREAARSGDPEVATRAKALIEKLDPPKKPGVKMLGPDGVEIPRGGAVIRFGAGGGAMVFRGVAGGGVGAVKMRTVRDGDNSVTIVESGKQISVTVVKKGAKPESYAAKDREEFKKKHKDVYMKYLATDEEKKAAAEAGKKAAGEKNAGAAE